MRFLKEDYTRVHLERAPLVLVLAQLRHSERPVLGERDTIDAIVEALDRDYPDVQPRTVQNNTIEVDAPGLVLHQEENTSHILRSPDHPWWISISPSVTTLATPEYEDREEFEHRFKQLRSALADVGGLPAVTRVAVRYVTQIADEDFLDNLDQYIKTAASGGVDLPVTDGTQLVQSMVDVLLRQESITGRVRAGMFPAGIQPDPAVPPIDVRSWIIDVDVWDDQFLAADEALDEQMAELAEGQYQMFRWLVTDDYIKYFKEAV